MASVFFTQAGNLRVWTALPFCAYASGVGAALGSAVEEDKCLWPTIGSVFGSGVVAALLLAGGEKTRNAGYLATGLTVSQILIGGYNVWEERQKALTSQQSALTVP